MVEDKLKFVEKSMQQILVAKQEAMEARIQMAELEYKLRAVEKIMSIRQEASEREAQARLHAQEFKANAQREIQESQHKAQAAREQVESLLRRIHELEDENQRLRQATN